MKHRRVPKDNYQELFRYARSYLSSAFPNPNREDCPEEAALIAMAADPLTADPYVEEHVSFCSPCFTRYMAVLDELSGKENRKAKNALLTWPARRVVWIGALALVAIVTGAHFNSWQFQSRTPETKTGKSGVTPIPPVARDDSTPAQRHTYVPVLIDLTNAAPIRGAQHPHNSPQAIPSGSRLELNLRLPLGSDELRYSIALVSGEQIAWSDSVQASREDGDTILRVYADFSHILPGNYDLQVASGGRRLTVPVLIKDTSPKTRKPTP